MENSRKREEARGDQVVMAETSLNGEIISQELVTYRSKGGNIWKETLSRNFVSDQVYRESFTSIPLVPILPADNPIFVNWDGRPGILYSIAPPSAVAILRPGGVWEPVDADDMANSGRVVASESAFKEMFYRLFGDFDIPRE